MASTSLPHLLQIINNQIELSEKLGQSLGKVTALLDVALQSGLSNYPQHTAHDYLFVISDLIAELSGLTNANLDNLMQCRTHWVMPKLN